MKSFFASKVTMFVGERPGADQAAEWLARELAGVGLPYEEMPCLQHEHVQIYHMGTVYTNSTDIDHFIRYANELRTDHGFVAQPPASPKMAPTQGRLDLRDLEDAVAILPPLVSTIFRLVTGDGRLAFGNWWLGSIDAGTFELARSCDLKNHRVDPYDHVIIEVWPTGDAGKRLDCIRGKPHTTMVHVPFGHDIALHLVDDDGMAGARNRTDDNLKRVFS